MKLNSFHTQPQSPHFTIPSYDYSINCPILPISSTSKWLSSANDSFNFIHSLFTSSHLLHSFHFSTRFQFSILKHIRTVFQFIPLNTTKTNCYQIRCANDGKNFRQTAKSAHWCQIHCLFDMCVTVLCTMNAVSIKLILCVCVCLCLAIQTMAIINSSLIFYRT